LTYHWLHGVVDGDGSLTVSNNKPRLEVYGASSIFLAQISDIVLEHFQITCKPRTKRTVQDGIRVTTKSEVQTLCSSLYSNATLFLPRKRQKAQLIIDL
jgi:hypothetical protein